MHPNKYMWYGCEAFITGSDRLCLDNRHVISPKLNLIKMESKNNPPTHCVFLLDVLWHDLIYANISGCLLRDLQSFYILSLILLDCLLVEKYIHYFMAHCVALIWVHLSAFYRLKY